MITTDRGSEELEDDSKYADGLRALAEVLDEYDISLSTGDAVKLLKIRIGDDERDCSFAVSADLCQQWAHELDDVN